MIGRREFALGGLISIVFGASPCCTAHAQPRVHATRGCWIADDDIDSIYPDGTDTRLYINGNEPMIPRSGDRDFDYALAQTLGKCSTYLNAAPGFAYYDDFDGLNAYATPKVRLNGADGTVLFGQGLLQKLMKSQDHPDLSVAAVCAHEFGHILQFKLNLFERVKAGQPTVKRPELQADFFSGYFSGLRKKEKPDFPAAVFAMTQYSFGDNMINSPNHHGTPDERAAAIVRGFEAGYRENKNLNDAIQTSINYVSYL